MSKQRQDRPLRAQIEIDASPGEVWRVVSDLRSTGKWSPECRRVIPLGGVRRGGWLLGWNRRKRARWATVSRIVRFHPPREIAWTVLTNGSTWTYRIEPTATGSQLIESRETPNGVRSVARAFTTAFLGGQRAHDDELEAGMSRSLQRIKQLVE
jgi:uncharacterized protein YndB with AHSA1/START domain